MNERESDLHSDLNKTDVELAQRIAQTLDDSTNAFDADARAQLTMIRHRALTSAHRKRVAGAVALAASVLALVAAPWMLRQQADERIADDMTYLSVEPEMLADMDMLLAIGESQ